MKKHKGIKYFLETRLTPKQDLDFSEKMLSGFREKKKEELEKEMRKKLSDEDLKEMEKRMIENIERAKKRVKEQEKQNE